jgi:hypothetical protein
MQFSPQDIHGAKQLRDLGLRWEPQLQDGVYFILDLKHFLRRAGLLDRLKQSMVWLPTWHQARRILQTMGVDNGTVAHALQAPSVLEHHQELRALYELVATRLRAMPPTDSQGVTVIHQRRF